ncbi:sugar-binding domain-containing protein [Aegicerativicinus sediminis]|uniref:sugar-binding domain-containing protein n=1 Tax=Aegicerativicinus sediminis TaxID=2893202 RepID=UPI001E32F16B|nr:sugar-binding domain-containing protein [Aegicerativicinus sediminis]
MKRQKFYTVHSDWSLKNVANVVLLFLIMIVTGSCEKKSNDVLDLSGNWHFQIDSLDQGKQDHWFTKTLSDEIRLPGSMVENGKGKEVSVNSQWTGSIFDSTYYTSKKFARYRQPDNIKVPFWLQPLKHYLGPAWYQKEVLIPQDWKGHKIMLTLERAHWQTEVWVGDVKVGMQNSLATPHNFNLTNYVKPGKNQITIRVDNRVLDIDPGPNSHSISDHTQSNWNGIVGNISMYKTPFLTLENIQLYPIVSEKKVVVKGRLSNASGNKQNTFLTVKAIGPDNSEINSVVKEIKIDTSANFQFDYSMGNTALLWDEFDPNLYTMDFELKSELGIQTKQVRFGMRDFKVNGKQFNINGRPIFLRGTLECSIFPKTGYPPTDIDSWKRIFNICKAHGLNHMRFHSWCPPKAAFDAADEVGFYLQVEASSWANQGSSIGDGKPIDEWIYKEVEAILSAYGNHPSFVMMAYGNEPGGKNQINFLSGFVEHFKNFDNRRLYTGGAGWPYFKNLDYYNSANGVRIQGWGEELNSIINREPPQTMFDFSQVNDTVPIPFVSHEIGQWCVYPNFKEMDKYTGVLKPKNFEIFKESLEENQMGDLADSLLLASGKLQALCYKADIEAALRTKDFAGFQLLDLHDFPGQGTALVGVLDAFWDEKGYITPEEFRSFSGQTVPLARMEKRTFLNNEIFKATIEIAHYGKNPIEGLIPKWELIDAEGNVFDNGDFNEIDIPIGNGIKLGEVSVKLNELLKPQKLTLVVNVGDNRNDWDIWVYPFSKKPVENEKNVLVTDRFDDTTIDYLKNGGKVLLNITKGDISPKKGGDIGIGFSSIFWNTSWTSGQKPHTLGILCNPKHKALGDFPTEYHSDWQWWDAMSHSNAIVLDDFDPKLKPIVRVVDDWTENRRLALIFEVKIGKGNLLFSGVDLHSNLENRIEARQLLYSLKKYMNSNEFNPEITLESDDIKGLLGY